MFLFVTCRGTERYIWIVLVNCLYSLSIMKQVSVMQYAEMCNCSRQWILFKIKHGKELTGVKKIEKVGRSYVITLN